MRPPRLPIGALMLGVVFAALLCVQVRAALEFNRRPATSVEFAYYGPPLLIGLNLLLLLLVVRLPGAWRAGRLIGSAWMGFQFMGWTALLGLALLGLTWGDTVDEYPIFERVVTRGAELLEPILDLSPYTLSGDLAEFAFCTLLLGLPVLAIALLGALVAWALGIEVEIRVRRRRPSVEPTRNEGT